MFETFWIQPDPILLPLVTFWPFPSRSNQKGCFLVIALLLRITFELKPWLAGRLFAAIPGDYGQRQHGQSEAIGGNIQCNVSTIFANEKCTRSAVNTGRFAQYFEQIADNCRWLWVFTGQNLYYAVVLYNQWRQFDVPLFLGIAGIGRCGVALPGIIKDCWEKLPV